MISDLDKRIAVLEDRNGQIDPRIVGLVILVILVLLYLRSIGVL